jgi:hypothetical protein
MTSLNKNPNAVDEGASAERRGDESPGKTAGIVIRLTTDAAFRLQASLLEEGNYQASGFAPRRGKLATRHH